MSSDTDPINPNSINTAGGAVIDGAVNTGGDFVGRDQTIHGDQVSGDKILGDKVLGDKNIITAEAAHSVQGLSNPYLGLRAFVYADRAIYAGREQLAQETVQRLTVPGAQQTIIFITGASGSGKSSFAQAGLIPLLESHYAAYQKTVRHAIFRPSSQPLVMLADALQKLHPDLTVETLTTNTPKDQINLLLIDQFEELFIQSDPSQRAPFCDLLTNLPSFADCRTHILITLRVDYLDELFAIQPLWAIAKEGVELRAMQADDLRSAIQKPLQVNHPQKRFAPELLARLVKDASADAALLPLLQVTLAELWKTGKLVLSNYHSLTDAIRQRAELVYTFSEHANADPKVQRPAQDQQALMSILLDLINVSVDGADRRDARQRRTRQELEQGSTHRPRLIEELVNARLLSAATESRNGEDVEVIDIIHESLIDNWDRLRQVIEEQRQQLQRRARFKLWLGEWVRNGRQEGYLLLTDIQLAEAQALVEVRDIEVEGGDARKFYQRSIEYHEAGQQKELQRVKELADAQRRRAQTFRWGVIVAIVLMLVALSFAGWGWRNSITASENEATAVAARSASDKNAAEAKVAQTNAEQQAAIAFSRQLAAQSTSELSKSRYEPAILLALAAGQITDTVEAFSAIYTALAPPAHSRIIFYGHTGAVTGATWNQDESKILTSSKDGTARIWDATTGQEVVKFAGHTDSVIQATWSRDESKILTASDDKSIRIWDAASGQELARLIGHTDRILQALWSWDESKILTASDDKSIRIWDATNGQELARLIGHTDRILQAFWNRGENKVLTTSGHFSVSYDATTFITTETSGTQDPTIRVWDATSARELLKLEGHTKLVWQATWNRDESKILTASDDETARLWDATSGKELLSLEGHTEGVLQATWNQDESKILTRSEDKTVRLWDAVSGKELVRLEGHMGSVLQAMWNQDESKILTRSEDKTVRLWDAVSGKELVRLEGHIGSVLQATWNQDESKILTASNDKTARIWDAVSGKELMRLEGHTAAVLQAIWSRDESSVLTYSNDQSVRAWDVVNNHGWIKAEDNTDAIWQAIWSRDESKILTYGNNVVRVLAATSGQTLLRLDRIHHAIWSQDESKILTTNDDSTASIWDSLNGKELVRFTGYPYGISDSLWNQDESKILTIGFERTMLIWDAKSGRELVRLEGHTGMIYQATWSQNESKILTASNDKTARIWDAASGQELVRLEGHAKLIWQATWNQDESKILTASADGTARIWGARTGKELVRLEGAMDSVTHAVWSQDESRILTISTDNMVRIWDAASGRELVRLDGHTGVITQATWSQDESRILTASVDKTSRIWDAVSDKELVRIEGHTGGVLQAMWNQDESKVLTASDDKTAQIWAAKSGRELRKFEGHTETVSQAIWNRDESKILTRSRDGTIRIWYTRMTDLLEVACAWTPRNFTWGEWNIYLKENRGDYRPTCPNTPIPLDAIAGIQEEARQQICSGQVVSGTQRLLELNGWLQVNGQFKNYGVDVPAFVAEVSATATAEAQPAQ